MAFSPFDSPTCADSLRAGGAAFSVQGTGIGSGAKDGVSAVVTGRLNVVPPLWRCYGRLKVCGKGAEDRSGLCFPKMVLDTVLRFGPRVDSS
jgi:hypothetical protein